MLLLQIRTPRTRIIQPMHIPYTDGICPISHDFGSVKLVCIQLKIENIIQAKSGFIRIQDYFGTYMILAIYPRVTLLVDDFNFSSRFAM